MVARTPSGGVKQSARRKARAEGHTLPGTDKFPINDKADLENAKHRIGTTTEPREKVVAYINRRARALGGKPVGGGKDRKKEMHGGHNGEHPPHHFAHGQPYRAD